MEDRQTLAQAIKREEVELTDETTYFTIKGKQDSFDENGYPIQNEPNSFTYAKQTGRRKMIKIDDRGYLMNPIGLYALKVKLDRWVPVNDKAFDFYLSFLKTKNQMLLRHAEKNLV